MSSFCLNNGFRLQKTSRAARRWKQRPKKPFYHVSRDKILHDSWSISAALARVFSDRHFERGEGPGDEVEMGKEQGKSAENKGRERGTRRGGAGTESWLGSLLSLILAFLPPLRSLLFTG